MLFLGTEARLTRGADGSIRSRFSDTTFDAWSPYLREFDRVVIVARVEDSDADAPFQVEGTGVSVLALPNYQGAGGLVRTLPQVVRVVRRSCRDSQAVYAGRVPGVVSSLLLLRARRLGADSVAMVVGDPVEVARSGAAGPVLRLAAPALGLVCRALLRLATRAVYVTEHVLQDRYPVRRGASTLVRTNVRLSAESFASEPRDFSERPDGPWRVITVGSQEATYKGHDVLIAAAAELAAAHGPGIRVTIVGGGRFHERYRELVSELGMDEQIELVGHVADPAEVRRLLRESDLFVLPSRTEGLPRALVEAMALGLPCIGSTVGGIPELLPEECLVPPGKPHALATAMAGVLSNPDLMTRLSRENLTAARRVAERTEEVDVISFFAGSHDSSGGDVR